MVSHRAWQYRINFDRINISRWLNICLLWGFGFLYRYWGHLANLTLVSGSWRAHSIQVCHQLPRYTTLPPQHLLEIRACGFVGCIGAYTFTEGINFLLGWWLGHLLA